MSEGAKHEKKRLSQFVFDGSRELGDRKRYTDVSVSVQKLALGAWRYLFYALVIVAGVSAIRTVLSLVLGPRTDGPPFIGVLLRRGEPGQMLILLLIATAAAVVLYTVVRRIRLGDQAVSRELEIWQEAAETVATRLQAERPDSDLLKDWSSHSLGVTPSE